MNDIELRQLLGPRQPTVLFSFPRQFPTGDATSDKLVALLGARTFQSKLEARLEPLGLLSPLPPPPLLQYILDKALVIFDTSDTVRAVADSSLPSEQKESLVRAYQVLGETARALFSKPLFIMPHKDRLYGQIGVTDIEGAMIAIKSAIESEGHLTGARIGYYDEEAKAFRTFYPDNTNESFLEHAALIIHIFRSFGASPGAAPPQP